MLRHIAMFAAVMAATASPAVVEAAPDSVVRVALLDVSAMAGGAWSGSGAPGMPQGGWPGGRGPGGWMRGPHLMGPGMMQDMMMGMMSMRIDRQAVKAGNVELDMTNWSRSLVHEVLIVPVDSPDAPLPYDYGTDEVVEDQINVLADSSELKPSESKTLEVDLSPGSYLLLCNVPGHYASGMVVPLAVTPR
jgi:uncharacterized cupredoxin-like copper-binding protein